MVETQQQTSEPDQTSPEQDQPTQSQDSVIPTEYAALAAGILIITVIAVVAYLFMKKKNRSSPVVISD